MRALVVALGLAASAVLAADSPMFQAELTADGARVTTAEDLPTAVWDKKCRQTLTLPHRAALREQLGKLVKFDVPESASFIDAHIANYRSRKEKDWLVCSGDVTVTDSEKSLAGLAVRAAWQPEVQEAPERLRALLQVAMAHQYSAADAVALVATLAPASERLKYLQAHLSPDALQMDAAKLAVMQLWSQDSRWEDVIDIGIRCDTVECRHVLAKAKDEQEKEDAEKVDDLSSYL